MATKTLPQGPLPDDLVFGFDHPHRIGTVCGINCEQCGGETKASDEEGESLPDAPLYIVASATKEDWKADIIKAGGAVSPRELSRAKGYYYFVRTD